MVMISITVQKNVMTKDMNDPI